MKSWLDNYKKAIVRTRWISIAGAAYVLLLVFREVYLTSEAISFVDGPLPDDLWWVVFRQLSSYLAIIVAFSYRLWMLIKAKEGYPRIAASWIISAATLVGYLAIESYLAGSACSSESNPCFTFYDISPVDGVLVSAIVYLFVSALRFSLTVFVAAFMAQTRFK